MNTQEIDVSKIKSKSNHGLKKAKKKRVTTPGVSYSPLELAEVEGIPFWNAIHDGQIKSITDNGLLAVIAKEGGSIDVFIPREELLLGVDRNIGQSIRLYLEDAILADANTEHPFKGSEIKAVDLALLDRAQEAKAKNEIVNGYVISEIKGGYCIVLFAESRAQADDGYGLRAFLPMGQAALRRDQGLLMVNEGEMLHFYISEFDPIRGNIVVSRRELLAQERKKDEEAFLTKYAVGDDISGIVSAVMPYGVFVNLGAMDGFLHQSDISWDKKPRLKELVPLGKEITAKIIEIDKENKKIKLSMKELNPDPWQSIDKNFRPGLEVEGDIIAFADFGAFVRLKDGIEGLIHLGEITWNRIKHPSQHFKLGDHVKALVLRVDKDTRKISLSTKALETSPIERLSGQFPVGAVLKTKIASIHDFGLFVELDEHTNGLVHKSEVSWVRNEEPLEQSFQVGQEIEVAVLGYDQARQRVSCSIKRAQEDDPWHRWKTQFKKGSVHKVKVASLNRVGVTCKLDGDLMGFCPRRELISGDNDQDRIMLKIGDEVEMMIVGMDMARQKINLSQKALAESETKRAYQSYLHDQNKSFGRTTLGDALRRDNNNKLRR